MPLVNPYSTRDALKQELGLRLEDTQHDARLEQSINDASRWVDDYTRQTWYAVDHTVTPLSLPPRSPLVVLNLIFPRYGFIRSIDRIVEGGSDVPSDQYSVLTDYIERLHGNWWNGDHNQMAHWVNANPSLPIQVFGLFGYPQPSADDPNVTDPEVVPVGLPARIGISAKLVAAALSGHSRKDVVGFDGAKQSIQDREIPQEVFDMLGARRALML